MKYLLLLLFPIQVFATQSFTTVIGVPIKLQNLLPTDTIESLAIDMANVQAYAIQANIDCPAACAGTIRFFSSIDKKTFIEIPPLTTEIIVTGTIIFNNINANFKWLRLEVENDNAIDAFTIEVLTSLKVGL